MAEIVTPFKTFTLKDKIDDVTLTSDGLGKIKDGKGEVDLFKYKVEEKNKNHYLIISQKEVEGFEHNHRIYKRSISNTDT